MADGVRRPARHRRRRGLQPALHPARGLGVGRGRGPRPRPAPGALLRARTGSTRSARSSERAAVLLRPGGVVGFEHADVQGESAPAVFAATGRWREVRDHRDLAGRPRCDHRPAGTMSAMSRVCPRRTDDERETALEAAALAVRRGQLVVLPTDTVYGVGADAFDPDAVAGLLEAKGRGRDMPPPVLISQAATARRARARAARLRADPDGALLAGAADDRRQAAAVAAVGPRRHPGHGRHPDARPPRRPRAARAHRAAGRELGQPHRPARRDRRRAGGGDARRDRSR